MVFKNLPIELDTRGEARLRVGGLSDPFGIKDMLRLGKGGEGEAGRRQIETEVAHTPSFDDNDDSLCIEVDPLTRASDRLSLRILLDFDNRRVTDARVEKTGFSGLELALLGVSPTDVVQIASRASGQASGANAIAAAMSLEMAYGIVPPPLALITRGLGAAAELLAAHTRHLFLYAGPDYSERVVSRTSPSLWAKAETWPANGAEWHGFGTIADLMRAINPLSGEIYLESLQLARTASEVATLVFGKFPHPSSLIPGGIGIEADKEIFNQILGRINRLIDYAKKVTAIWDDLADFFLEADPQNRQVGALPVNLISMGLWDDPAVYDARYEKCGIWGEARLSTPGVIVNGKLRTTRLTELNLGIEEFSDRAFFESWGDQAQAVDPLGMPLSPLHPSNRQTIPEPARSDWDGKYSWTAAPRWDREPVETGPLARQWISALGGKLKNEFIHASATGLMLDLPKFQKPARRLQWRIPEFPNAFERNRARAYQIGYSGLIALTYLLKAFNCLQQGERAMSVRYQVPHDAVGTGFWEEGQGALSHHIAISGGRISGYRILPASAWMGSPQDSFGRSGPYEQALINTPVLEECADADDFTGIDMLRAIRSFDP